MNSFSRPTMAAFVPWSARWWVGKQPVCWLVCDEYHQVPDALRELEALVEGKGWVAVGSVSYDAAPAFRPEMKALRQPGFPLLSFALYKPSGLWTGKTLPQAPHPIKLPPLNWPEGAEQYLHKMAQIREWIAQGDIYQLNYTLRGTLAFQADAWSFFLSRLHRQVPGYAAYLDLGDWRVCSFSPELFFMLQGQHILSRPMKGTMPRGLSYEQDIRQARLLRASEKNRAENLMIVDMVRNDLAQVARRGTVSVKKLFDIEKYPNVWQMTSTVQAQTRAGLPELFKALFPAASITGAPKIRAMKRISQIEDTARGLYCGTIGVLFPGRRWQFQVAIRTAVIDSQNRQLVYGSGGGIVWDSRPEEEWKELVSKTRVLADFPRQFQLLETLLWDRKRGYVLLHRHLARLVQSARYFQFRCSPARIHRLLEEKARSLLQKARSRAVVRLLLSADGQCCLEEREVPAVPAGQRVKLSLARQPVHSNNPFLYHKTTFREVYQQAQPRHRDAEEVLLWNERGELTETPIANLVLQIKGRLFTPSASCGLLNGTFRAELLEKGVLQEAVLRVEDLACAERIFLINSVRGWREARWLAEENEPYPPAESVDFSAEPPAPGRVKSDEVSGH